MNRAQSNYFNMVKAVSSLFSHYSHVWKNEPLIVKSIGNINSICEKIRTTASLQLQNDTKGYTASADRQRTQLKEQLFNFGNRMKVYAQQSGDDIVKARVAFSLSKLNSFSLNKLLSVTRSVADTASWHLESLAEYKIVKEDVSALYNILAEVENLNAQRDSIKSRRAEITTQLAGMFRDLRNELKLMDTQVRAYIQDDTFAGAYFNTRRINDVSGGTPRKPAGDIPGEAAAE